MKTQKITDKRITTIYWKPDENDTMHRVKHEVDNNELSISVTITRLITDGFKYRDLVNEGEIDRETDHALVIKQKFNKLERMIDELKEEINGSD